jgi:hypothetical protein
MRAINVFLALAVSLAMFFALLEGGLRLLDKGPPPSLLQPDPELGWSKKPHAEIVRKTSAFRVHFATNSDGLRDDPIGPKRDGEFRVLALGDSFTFGFGVERDQHFVDLLEGYWRSEGRDVRVINAGTEAWDTAQAARWLELHGSRFQPDAVLVFPYENDLYWNSQTHYLTHGRVDKPRYREDGTLEARTLAAWPPRPWHQRWALTRTLGFKPRIEGADQHFVSLPGAQAPLEGEVLPLLANAPESHMAPIRRHTLGALRAIERTSREIGAVAVVAPIPSGVSFEADFAPAWSARFRGLSNWSADRPVDLFHTLAAEAGLRSVDVRPAFAAARKASEERLYHPVRADWHLNEHGSREFAEYLHTALEGLLPLPDKRAEGALPPLSVEARGFPFAAKLYLGLLAVLSILYWTTYPKENRALASLKIAALLGLVFGIFLGLIALQQVLSPAAARWLVGGFVVLVLGFVGWKLGRRTGTIAELLSAFVRRGHWYLMPLVVVLVTIGSLLVVAASSPLVAPFIYTLF